MGLYRTVSEININFSQNRKIFPPHVFAPPLKGSPFNWVPAVSSALWIQCTNVTDGQTDGRTDTGRQQRPRLRIASRGKNEESENDKCRPDLVNRRLFCYFNVCSFSGQQLRYVRLIDILQSTWTSTLSYRHSSFGKLASAASKRQQTFSYRPIRPNCHKFWAGWSLNGLWGHCAVLGQCQSVELHLYACMTHVSGQVQQDGIYTVIKFGNA